MGLGGVAGCASSEGTDGGSTPTATPSLPFSHSGDSAFPTYSGTVSVSGDDDYWSFKLQMPASFGLRYRVTNRASEGSDFDAFVLPPEQYRNYLQEIRDTGPAIEEVEALSSQAVRSEAQRSGTLDAGTYYFVVDNTDIGDAGDIGPESTREVAIELETYDPAAVTETATMTDTPTAASEATEQTRLEQLKEQYPNWAFIDGQTELVVLKPLDASADSYSVTISGTLVNESDTDYEYAQITFGLFTGRDGAGAKVGTAVDNISGLDSGRRWQFEAVGSAEDASSFEIDDTTAY